LICSSAWAISKPASSCASCSGVRLNHRLFVTLPGSRARMRTKQTPAISHDQGQPYPRSEPSKGSFSLGLEVRHHKSIATARRASRSHAASQSSINAVAGSAGTNLSSNPPVGSTHLASGLTVGSPHLTNGDPSRNRHAY
jgi:hypothetical protein